MRKLLIIFLLFNLVVACAKKRPDKMPVTASDEVEKSAIREGQEWYLAETITSVSDDSRLMVAEVSKGRIVKFRITEKYLVMYEVDPSNHESEVTKKEGKSLVQGQILSRFPIKDHFDVVRVKDDHGEDTNVFEKKNDSPDRPWYSRNKIKVAWDEERIESRKVDSDMAGAGSYQEYIKQFENGGDLLRADISQTGDKIDIIVTKQISHTNDANDLFELRKFLIPVKKTNYRPKKIDEKWLENIGLFTTRVKSYDKKTAVKNTYYVNRWDLSNNHITYYFSKSWDTELGRKYKPLMIKAIEEWNKVFKEKMGLDSFILYTDSDGTQTIGDLRYNMIEWTTGDYTSLGYGPSLVDPRNGEIINANVNINIEGMIAEFYYLSRSEKLINNFKKMDNSKTMVQSLGSSYLEANSEAFKKTNEFLQGLKSNEFNYKVIDFSEKFKSYKELTKQAGQYKRKNGLMDSARFLLSGGKNASLGINETSSYKGFDQDQFLEKYLMATFVHEIGHTLGLSHNFKGSIDVKNFYQEKNENGKYKHALSSIMDYYGNPENMLLKPGPYDYAAIEKSYSDSTQHDLENVPLDKNKVKEYFKEKFPFEFCSDMMVDTDPLCNQYDEGVSAEEIVSYYVKRYHDSYAYRNRMYEDVKRFYGEEVLTRYLYMITNYYFNPIRTFLDYFEKRRLEYIGQDKEDDTKKMKAFYKGNKAKELQKNLKQKEDEFLKSKEGADLAKAAYISMNFFFSVIFSDHDDHDKIANDGTVEQIGVLVDRLFALYYLNLPTISNLIYDSGIYGNIKNTYYDFAKRIGQEADYEQKYNTIISGVFTKFDTYSGFDLNPTTPLLFIHPALRKSAASMIFSGDLKHKDKFQVSIEYVDRRSVSAFINLQEEFKTKYNQLREKFIPIVFPGEGKTSELLEKGIMWKRGSVDPDQEMDNQVLREIIKKMSDPLTMIDQDVLTNQYETIKGELKSLVSEKDLMSEPDKLKTLTFGLGKLRKIQIFKNVLDFNLNLDQEEYVAKKEKLFRDLELNKDLKNEYEESLRALIEYNSVKTKYDKLIEIFGIKKITYSRMDEIIKGRDALLKEMEENFSPVLDAIHLYSEEKLRKEKVKVMVRPTYKKLIETDEGLSSFLESVSGLSTEQLASEYFYSDKDIPEKVKSVTILIDKMWDLKTKIARGEMNKESSLQQLLELQEKILLKSKLLEDGNWLNVMSLDEYRKNLAESKRKNKFSKEYYEKKEKSLVYLQKLDELYSRYQDIYTQGNTIKILDYENQRIVETPGKGIMADLAIRIYQIEDMIEVLKQENGNEERIKNLQEYKAYELDFLGDIKDFYRILVPGA